MKALICGLGAIGQRHLRFLREATDNQIDIAVFRQRKLQQLIATDLSACEDIDPVEFFAVKSFDDFNQALAWQPDMVFVTNPIAMHMQIALPAAEAGCHLFIEKPLSNERQGAERLLETVRQQRLVCMIGYQTRLHPAYKKIHEYLQKGLIGDILGAELCYGEWLPGMHPYTDYRTSHESIREQGGGVILCLSHDIDVAAWLFGMPTSVRATGGQLSDLELNVEDSVDLHLEYGHTENQFNVSIHLDFIMKPKRRDIRIEGRDGCMVYDHGTGVLQVSRYTEDKTEVHDYSQQQRNSLFKAEIAAFLDAVNNQQELPVSLEDGLATLDICLAAKQSLIRNSGVML